MRLTKEKDKDEEHLIEIAKQLLGKVEEYNWYRYSNSDVFELDLPNHTKVTIEREKYDGSTENDVYYYRYCFKVCEPGVASISFPANIHASYKKPKKLRDGNKKVHKSWTVIAELYEKIEEKIRKKEEVERLKKLKDKQNVLNQIKSFLDKS